MTTLGRRQFIQCSALGALCAGLPGMGATADASAKPPNIIFIMVDDMGYRNLGCYGSKTIQTPNIDKMCAEGLKFTDCYAGDSVCAPSRSTLMTGYHIGHTPVRSNGGGTPIGPEDTTVADVLKKAGYITGGFGKWGLGNEGTVGAAEKHGFDTFFGYYNQKHAHDYYTTHLFRNSERVELEGPEHNVIGYGKREKREGKYSHYAIFEETVKFIKESTKSGKPFFCYAPWTPPHASFYIPEADPAWALYKDKPWNPAKAKVVAAMDTMVDRHVGEILSLLKELGIDENTIVFFTSDNGASRAYPGLLDSSGELKGIKGSKYEGGIRVPMVVRWPGRIKAGTVSDLPCYFPDVMPTLAELAGVSQEVPEDTDGISVVPTLLGKGDQKKHEYLFWKGAIRMGNWKGVGTPGTLSLYDLSTDISETSDLSETHPEIVAKLTRFMEEAWTEPSSQETKSDNGQAGKPVKVFILSGQSNMAGGGHVVPEGLRFDATVGDKVQVWDACGVWGKQGVPVKWASLNQLQTIKKEARMDSIGPEFGFAKSMSELYPADEIRLIKVARGGTAIDWWLPDAKGKENGLTGLLANLKNALETIGGDYEIAGMLWMQGESDAKQQADAEVYQKKLAQLIALMRKETGKPELPFVIGRLSTRILDSPKFKMPFVKIVQSGQEAVAKSDKYVYVINTDDLSQRDDLVHFDQEGQMGLGKRFGEAMGRALK